MGYWEEIPPCEGSGALEQGAQRSFSCPWISGSVQGQVGWSLEQLGIVGGVPVHGRGLELGEFRLPSNPNDSVIHSVIPPF